MPARTERDGHEALALIVVVGVIVGGCIVGALILSGIAWRLA